MPTTAIRMTDNSFDSRGMRLGFGSLHRVPDDISAKDAEILIRAGKARPSGAAAPVASELTVSQIREKLDALKVAHKPTDKKGHLLQLLQQATAGGE